MIEKYLLSRYPGDHQKTVTVRKFLERICRRHIGLGLADATFESNLCSGDNSRYWQRLSEAFFTHELLELGLDLRPSHHGPDILLQHDDRHIWIEIICPKAEKVPDEWLQQRPGVAVSLPHEAILLRWTSAIKEKAEKLIGKSEKEGDSAKGGYIEKGIVGVADPYVIAINGRLLRGECFGSILGISQFPYAVEAVFPVGPYQVKLDPHTLQAVGEGYQYRPTIQNHNGSQVPAYIFLNPDFRQISAIWAADMDGTAVIGNSSPMAVIHNPNAANPIPLGLLPADWEYVASKNADEYVIERLPGRLAN